MPASILNLMYVYPPPSGDTFCACVSREFPLKGSWNDVYHLPLSLVGQVAGGSVLA